MIDNVFYILTADEGELLFSGSATECMNFLFYLEVKYFSGHGVCMIGESIYKELQDDSE